MKLKIIQKRNWFFAFSGTLVLLSVIFFFTWGLNLGIDFTGGSLMSLSYPKTAPSVLEVQKSLSGLSVKSLSVQPTENNGLILRFQNTDEATHQGVITALNKLSAKDNQPIEQSFEAVGPSIGKELAANARTSIVIVLLAIILYVAWAFRHVSKPVASWKYGVAGVIALFHDVIIVVGVYCVLGRYMGVEVNGAFVAALLTVLGYSVNDTIVVFDRIRERLPKSDENFEGTINTSINQTIVRSINTSMTVMLTLLSIVLFGGASIRYFALALLIGIFFGTYSSIFIASPLLMWFQKVKK